MISTLVCHWDKASTANAKTVCRVPFGSRRECVKRKAASYRHRSPRRRHALRNDVCAVKELLRTGVRSESAAAILFCSYICSRFVAIHNQVVPECNDFCDFLHSNPVLFAASKRNACLFSLPLFCLPYPVFLLLHAEEAACTSQDSAVADAEKAASIGSDTAATDTAEGANAEAEEAEKKKKRKKR